MGCSITNIGECIVEFLFDFLIDMINGALQPFLNLIHKFLTEPVSIKIFAEPWSIIVYILSMFYGILLVYIGIRFITAGESPEQREKAKSSLRNIIIMMILIQASFLLYDLILGISASLTKVIIEMIHTDFFIITLENYTNLGFDLMLSIIYLFFLIITLVILLLRYICVSAGLLFFTIGIFFYFIPALNQYGKLILNALGVLIFLPFFYALIFLSSAKLLDVGSFHNFKTLVMIGSFSLVIILTLLLLLFVIVKAALKFIVPTSKAIKTIKSLT